MRATSSAATPTSKAICSFWAVVAHSLAAPPCVVVLNFPPTHREAGGRHRHPTCHRGVSFDETLPVARSLPFTLIVEFHPACSCARLSRASEATGVVAPRHVCSGHAYIHSSRATFALARMRAQCNCAIIDIIRRSMPCLGCSCLRCGKKSIAISRRVFHALPLSYCPSHSR